MVSDGDVSGVASDGLLRAQVMVLVLSSSSPQSPLTRVSQKDELLTNTRHATRPRVTRSVCLQTTSAEDADRPQRAAQAGDPSWRPRMVGIMV